MSPIAAETSEGRWRSVWEHVLDGMLLTSPDGRVHAANPAACALLGRSEAEVCAAGREELIVKNAALEHFLVERSQKGKARAVLTMRRRDGSTFPADTTSALFVEADGAERTAFCFRDVTDAERARHTLAILADAGRVLASSLDPQATLTALTHLVVPHLADACAVDVVEDGQVRRVAVAHRDPGKVQAFLGARRPLIRTASAGGVDRVLNTGEPSLVAGVSDEVLRELTHDEDHLEVARGLGMRSFLATPLIAHGRILGALSLVSVGGVPDFTRADLPLVQALAARAALALDNARRHQEAIDARRLRDDVLGIVSHDLRNPLNTILLNAAVLARTAPGAAVEAIKVAVQRADRLIQDLLLAAKVESGGLEVLCRPEDAASLVGEVLALFRALADAKALTLIATPGPHLGEFNVDRHRVVQLLSNLVGNAIKLTPTGGRVELCARGESDAVVFSVADNGPGIAPEDLPHIFDRFWQSAQTREAGAGLGLSIARGIAEAHGGKILVESQLHAGATFTVRLPRAGPPSSPTQPRGAA